MKTIQRLIAPGVLLLGMSAAMAHHAFSPVYDGSRTLTMTGVVTEFKLVNPHGNIAIDVTDDSGNVTRWNVELDGRLNLTNHGWDGDTITVGERLTVTGNPTHTGSPNVFWVRVELADGTAFARGADYIDSIEDERRQRIEARKQQSTEGR